MAPLAPSSLLHPYNTLSVQQPPSRPCSPHPSPLSLLLAVYAPPWSSASTYPTQKHHGNYSLCPEYTFCICGFTYTWTATCNQKILGVFSQIFADWHRTVKNVSINTHIPSWGPRNDALACCFCSGCKHVCFSRSVSCRVIHILRFLLVISVFETVPQYRADMLTAVPGPVEKSRAWDELLSGMSCSTISPEFNVMNQLCVCVCVCVCVCEMCL